jgi:biopolymer transport protein ExbD
LRQIATQKLTENDKMIFSVKTDGRTKYRTYVEVIDQLKRANATRISIAETE